MILQCTLKWYLMLTVYVFFFTGTLLNMLILVNKTISYFHLCFLLSCVPASAGAGSVHAHFYRDGDRERDKGEMLPGGSGL